MPTYHAGIGGAEVATGQRGGGRWVSWTVPLRSWESHLLTAMFDVLQVRAGQRVSRARWLMARAQVLLQAATTDETLPPSTRSLAVQALADYERHLHLAERAALERQQRPSWDVLAR